MAGLRSAGCILVIALIPAMLSGCAGSGSYLSKFRKPSESPDQLWARAQQYERDQQFAEARQLYAELYHSDPKTARYVHRFAVVSMMLNDHQRAHSAFQRAYELEPDNPELLADMGYSAYLQQEYAQAEQLLSASLQQAPNNPRAKSNLALAIGCQGRYDESLVLFREIHGQDEAEVLCNLAYVKSQRGDVGEARKLYKQVLALDPDMKKAKTALAQLKAPGNAAQTVADGKPYHKYMNRPAETKQKPAAKPVEAVAQAPAHDDTHEDAFSLPEGVKTVSNSREEPAKAEPAKPQSSPATEDSWAAAADESASQAPREFPVEEESAAGSLQSLKEPQTVATDAAPFTVIEETPVIAAPVIAAPVIAAPVKPAPTAAPAELLESSDEPFSPDWLKNREQRISDRAGQSGFMGFCPVALRDKLQLVDASPEYAVDYHSQKFQFSTDEALKKFLADPDRYLPAAGGLDVVAVSQGTAVAQGSLEHALWFRHKLYLFLSREHLETFRTQAREFAVPQ